MYSILAQTMSTGDAFMSTLLPMIILFAAMYFMMIRPQQKEQKKKDLMLSELAVGDTVLTSISQMIQLSLNLVTTETVVSQCRKQQLLWLKNQKMLSKIM